MTVGLDLSDSEQPVSLDVRLNVRAGSPFSRALGRLERPASQFSNAGAESAALTVATTWRLEGEPADIAGEFLARVRGDLAGQLQPPAEQIGPHPIERILTVISNTIDEGQVDGLVQFVNAEDEKFVLIAAARVADANALSLAMQEILQHLRQSQPDRRVIDVNAVEVDGVRMHRIRLENVRRQDRRLYGDDVAVYLGAGRDTVWLAMGGAQVRQALLNLLQGSPEPGPGPETGPLPLLSASLHLSDWIAVAAGGNSERERKLVEAARFAFPEGAEDEVRAGLFVDGSGLRLNVLADRGYIRLVGVVLAARMREGQRDSGAE